MAAKKAAKAPKKPTVYYERHQAAKNQPPRERPSIEEMRAARQAEKPLDDGPDAIYNDVTKSGRMARAARRQGTGGYVGDTW